MFGEIIMGFDKSYKTIWFLHCFLLFSPFLVERYLIAPITLSREPLYLWGTIHWIYCYIAYGVVCLIHYRWRKKIDCNIAIKPKKHDYKYVLISVVIGIVGGYIFAFFSGHGVYAPMIYRELTGYMRQEPLWMGIAGFAMQYIYYIFEFVLIAFIIDCAQKTTIRLGWTQGVPWGGIFLALTWGLMHRYGIIPSALRGEYIYSMKMTIMCLSVGFAYMLPGKKFTNSFFTIMSWYWLT